MPNRGIDIVGKSSDISSARRIALVFGNSDYDYAPLKNCVNDAQDMADALKNVIC